MKMVRHAATGTVVALSLGLCGTVSAYASDTDEGQAEAENITTLNLYNLTDIHGHIEQQSDKSGKVTEAGLAAIGCYLDKARAQGEDAALTLLGDNIGASPYTSGSLLDNPTIEALNELAPLASTIGNHELDLGVPTFKHRIDGTEGMTKVGFPYLGANIEGMGRYLGDKVIWTSNSGVKVAYIGAIAEDVPYKLSPGTTQGLTFTDPIAKINTMARELKTSGQADVVIAMLDDDVKNNYPKMGAYVDGIMGGDTHVPYSFSMVKGAENNLLSGIASGSYTDNLANLKITYNKKTRKVVASEAVLIPASTIAKCGEKDSVARIVDKAKVDSAEAGKKVVASGITASFSRGVFRDPHQDPDRRIAPGSNRGIESSLGDLVADSMRHSITTAEGKPVDIGMINAGGLRADLTPNSDGTITYRQTYAVAPFSNELGYVSITGADVKKALEQQWKTNLNSQNSRPMLKLGLSSNVKYTYDPAKPYGERITTVTINDEPLDMTRVYTVGSVTFLLHGGDSFDALTANGAPTVLGTLDRDGFNSYLKAHPGITPRSHKSSIGISLPTQPVADGEMVDVHMRGLSFSEGPSQSTTVTVTIGQSHASSDVNNDLTDTDANNEKAIITTDGAGQAVVRVKADGQCTPEKSGQIVDAPVRVTTNLGDVVTVSQGLTLAVACPTSNGPARADDKPTPQTDHTVDTHKHAVDTHKDAADTHKHTAQPARRLAHTGLDARGLAIAALATLIIGCAARRHARA
ncbi:bifunctional metallophosphatase/5'-nucleotidase [Arcanobacterium haemolyticum]|nr:bifunctional metallophosphatase/5'-nucleotidase [Arcanobacterium haemolyticum]